MSFFRAQKIGHELRFSVRELVHTLEKADASNANHVRYPSRKDAFVGWSRGARLERWSPNNEFVCHNSECPNVNVEIVGLSFDHFRSEVIKSATERFSPRKFRSARVSKVTNFDFTIIADEQIFRLEVTVNHTSVMAVPLQRRKHSNQMTISDLALHATNVFRPVSSQTGKLLTEGRLRFWKRSERLQLQKTARRVSVSGISHLLEHTPG